MLSPAMSHRSPDAGPQCASGLDSAQQDSGHRELLAEQYAFARWGAAHLGSLQPKPRITAAIVDAANAARYLRILCVYQRQDKPRRRCSFCECGQPESVEEECLPCLPSLQRTAKLLLLAALGRISRRHVAERAAPAALGWA